MKRIGRKAALIVGVLAVVGAVTGSVAIASGGDDDTTQKSITGSALDRAKEAALVQTGQGRVTATEVKDEESYYEVEVTLDDGSQVDVQLDRSFNFVGSEGDGRDDD
jgi:uncharacterized membrane protein YkoI